MTIKLHARKRAPLPKKELYFTSFRLPLKMAQGIDVRAQKVSKDSETRVSFSEAIVQVLEQFVSGTKTPKGFKSTLKASKHARDNYEKPAKKKAKSVKKTKAKAKAKVAARTAKKPQKTHFKPKIAAKAKAKAPRKAKAKIETPAPIEPVANGVAETPPETAAAT